MTKSKGSLTKKIFFWGLLATLGVAWTPEARGAEGVPPPPPYDSTELPTGPGAPPAPPVVDPGAAVQTQASVQDDVAGAGLNNSELAAPSISDEQQIKNAMEMAYQLYHAEDYEACAKATAAILERFPKRNLYWVHYLYGLCLEHQERYTNAIEQYQLVRKQAARSTYANAAAFRVGLCQLKAGQSLEAIYTLRDIIENNPRSEYRLQAYIHLGNLYRRTRDWRAARRIYKDMIRYYPNTAWAWTSAFYLAETYAHQGKLDTAIKVYAALASNEQAPRNLRAQAQLRIGDLYITDQKWLEALQTYKHTLRDYNDIPGVAVTCEEKLKVATEGRRYGRVPYRQVKTGVHLSEAPPDEGYRLKQQQEKVPYSE